MPHPELMIMPQSFTLLSTCCSAPNAAGSCTANCCWFLEKMHRAGAGSGRWLGPLLHCCTVAPNFLTPITKAILFKPRSYIAAYSVSTCSERASWKPFLMLASSPPAGITFLYPIRKEDIILYKLQVL